MLHLSRLALSTTLLLAMACGHPEDQGVVHHKGRVIDATSFEELVNRPSFGALRSDPAQFKSAVLREAVIETALLADPPDEAELELIERIVHLQMLERCSTVELRKRWATAGDPDGLARAYFEDHRSEFDVPDTFILQLIFLPADKPGAEDLAQSLLRRVKDDPASFGALADEHSKSETSSAGGITPPLKATDVHPTLAREVAAHRDSTAPFLVATDRGHYIIRVVRYLEGSMASYERVAYEAGAAARRAFTDDFHRETVRRLAESQPIELNESLLHAPKVTDDTVVYAVGGRSFRVSDVLPGWQPEPPISGPMLRRSQERHLERFAVEQVIGCSEVASDDQMDAALISSRIGPALRSFVTDEMRQDLDDYLATHRAVMQRPARHDIDLFALPILSHDPYHDMESYGALIRGIADASASSADVTDIGGWMYNHAIAADQLLATYDPTLPARIRALAPGEVAGPFLSQSAQAYLIVRLNQLGENVELDPGIGEDLDLLVSHYLAEHREPALEHWYESLVGDVDIDHDAVDRIIERNGSLDGRSDS